MLQITDKAVSRLSYLAATQNKQYVRLSVKGGGCAGYNYDWSTTNEREATDGLFEDVLIVSFDLEFYLLGTTLDWVEDTFKAEFVISNPNSKSSCGCGESFSV